MNIDEQISWLIANTSATNTIIRALAEANQDNHVFLESIRKLHEHRAGNYLASTMSDSSIAEYEKALKELLPVSVRSKVFQ